VKGLLVKAWMTVFGHPWSPLIKEINRVVESSCESLLDVGCGPNSPLQHLRFRPGRLVGIDACSAAVEQSRALGIHDDCVQMSALGIREFFGAESFDCVLALEVIEHLREEDALALISRMEQSAKGIVITSTPNGFFPQEGTPENPWQEHRSGWTPKRMEAMGYYVIGLGGLKCLRGKKAQMRWPPRPFWRLISILSQVAVRGRPEYAFEILCVKKKRQGEPKKLGTISASSVGSA
jgi:SAM-dependent methyltransferase